METAYSTSEIASPNVCYPTEWAHFLHYLEIGDADLSLVQPDSIVEPFRGMLVHSQDMTPTLEHFAECRIGLSVLRCETDRSVLLRQVLLLAEGFSRAPLVLGNIRILLNNLSANARAMVLDGVIPFGTILRQEHLDHCNDSAGFFCVRLSRPLSTYFGADYGQIAYGRYREMHDHNKALLAQVMEILSPLYTSVKSLPITE